MPRSSLGPLSYARPEPSVSRPALWLGWVVSLLPALALLMGGVMDLLKPPFVVEGVVKMGYPERVIVPLGVVVLISVLIYLFPRTAVLGAILLTGYLGGAVATHVRAGDPFFGRILVPTYFGFFLWGGLYLRDARIRALVPFRRPA